MNAVCNASVKPQNTISIPANNKGKDISSQIATKSLATQDWPSHLPIDPCRNPRCAARASGVERRHPDIDHSPPRGEKLPPKSSPVWSKAPEPAKKLICFFCRGKTPVSDV